MLELRGGRKSLGDVAAIEGTAEAVVSRALRVHERMFARPSSRGGPSLWPLPGSYLRGSGALRCDESRQEREIVGQVLELHTPARKHLGRQLPEQLIRK